MSLAVVGLDFPNEKGAGGSRRFELALMRPGDPVELRREPKNPVDPRAVGVWSERGVRLGFLTAERCGWIGARIARGEAVAAVFQAAGSTAASVRVRFGGGAPVLPGDGGDPGNDGLDGADRGAFDDGWPGWSDD